MRRITTKFLYVFLISCVLPCWSCQFDTDCQIDSKCIKSSGSVYGICAGGLNPGNSNDQQPVSSYADPNGTVGNTCSFDTDCGVGSLCFKTSGSINGVCIRK